MGGCNEQATFSAWFWRMGWRYVAAIASLMMFGLLAARVFDEAETLRALLMAGVVNILVLVLAVPIEKPKGERGWLKAAGSLGTSGALMYITWLSVHEEIELLVAGQGGDAATDWWIIGGYFVFSLIAAAASCSQHGAFCHRIGSQGFSANTLNVCRMTCARHQREEDGRARQGG